MAPQFPANHEASKDRTENINIDGAGKCFRGYQQRQSCNQKEDSHEPTQGPREISQHAGGREQDAGDRGGNRQNDLHPAANHDQGWCKDEQERNKEGG